MADLQNLGVPLRFARELMALAQGNTPSPPSPPAVAASEPPARAPPAPLPPAPPAPPRSGGGRSGNAGPEPRQTGHTPAVVPPRKANPRPAQPAQPAPPAHPPAQPPAQPPQPPAQPPAQPPQPTKAPAPPAAFARGPLPKKAEGESKGDQKGNWSNWRNEPNEKNDWDRRDRGKGSSSNSNQWNSWQSHPKTKGNTSNSKGSQEKEWDWNNANSKNGSSSWYKSGGEHYHSDNHNPKGNKGANTNPAKQVQKLFTHKIFIDIEDPDPSFNLNTRLVGQNGQNVKHIREITGATVNLSGKGTADRANADENLHVLLQSHDPHTLDEAVKITNDLIDTVLEQYATFHAEKETEETDSWKGSGKAGKNRGKFARRYSNQQKNYNNSHFEEPAPKRSRGYWRFGVDMLHLLDSCPIWNRFCSGTPSGCSVLLYDCREWLLIPIEMQLRFQSWQQTLQCCAGSCCLWVPCDQNLFPPRAIDYRRILGILC